MTGNCIRKLSNKLKTPLKQQSNHCNETKYQDTTTTTATTLSILLKGNTKNTLSFIRSFLVDER